MEFIKNEEHGDEFSIVDFPSENEIEVVDSFIGETDGIHHPDVPTCEDEEAAPDYEILFDGKATVYRKELPFGENIAAAVDQKVTDFGERGATAVGQEMCSSQAVSDESNIEFAQLTMTSGVSKQKYCEGFRTFEQKRKRRRLPDEKIEQKLEKKLKRLERREAKAKFARVKAELQLAAYKMEVHDLKKGLEFRKSKINILKEKLQNSRKYHRCEVKRLRDEVKHLRNENNKLRRQATSHQKVRGDTDSLNLGVSALSISP